MTVDLSVRVRTENTKWRSKTNHWKRSLYLLF